MRAVGVVVEKGGRDFDEAVPIGGGSGACGLITVRNAIGSKARIIGLGARNADAIERSWRSVWCA